jgi:hypothetical protein
LTVDVGFARVVDPSKGIRVHGGEDVRIVVHAHCS